MYTVRIKRVVRPLYRALVRHSPVEEEKAAIRDKVMRLPIGPTYPYDVEAKLLRSIGVAPAVLDIGANSGIYSTVLEDIVGPAGLYLFEPLPYLHTALRTRFPKAHVFELALSNATALRHIRVPFINGARFDTRASLNAHQEFEQTGCEEILIRCAPLDSIVATLPLRSIGLMKIDVEGHELAVLEGAAATIRQYRPLLLIEIESRHHAFPITDVFAFVEGLGYRGFFINPRRFELQDLSALDVARDQDPALLHSRHFFDYLGNFFFVPRANVRDFVSRATAFLESERRLARPGA